MWWLRFELFHGWMVLSLRILTLLRMMQQTIRVNIYLFKCSASSSPYCPFSYLLFVCLFAVGSHCGRSAAMEDARTNTESALESGECALDWCLFSCNFHKSSMEMWNAERWLIYDPTASADTSSSAGYLSCPHLAPPPHIPIAIRMVWPTRAECQETNRESD